MANPQKENGYTPIANEILEQLSKVKLSDHLHRILLVVWRYTYGYSRKSYKLSETFLSQATGIGIRQIKRELKSLFNMKILTVIEESSHTSARVISFNKDFEQWNVCWEASNMSPGDISVTRGHLSSTCGDKSVTQKSNIKKANKSSFLSELPSAGSDDSGVRSESGSVSASGTMLDEKGPALKIREVLEDSRLARDESGITKKHHRKPIYKHDTLYYKAAKWLADQIESRIPDYRKHTEATLQTWADSARLMFERDKRNIDLARELLVFSQMDDFWKNIILSIPKFRDQFDQLNIRYNEQRTRNLKLLTKDNIGHFENYHWLGE